MKRQCVFLKENMRRCTKMTSAIFLSRMLSVKRRKPRPDDQICALASVFSIPVLIQYHNKLRQTKTSSGHA